MLTIINLLSLKRMFFNIFITSFSQMVNSQATDSLQVKNPELPATQMKTQPLPRKKESQNQSLPFHKPGACLLKTE